MVGPWEKPAGSGTQFSPGRVPVSSACLSVPGGQAVRQAVADQTGAFRVSWSSQEAEQKTVWVLSVRGLPSVVYMYNS